MTLNTPLSRRKGDIFLIVFFSINLIFVTYMFDVAQLLPLAHGEQIWPPEWFRKLLMWYGKYDPITLARPPFWIASAWLDVLFFGPFYVAAIFAFWKGKTWIRNWCFIWATSIITATTIILYEEYFGVSASPAPLVVTAANAGWIIVPVLVMVRMWR